MGGRLNLLIGPVFVGLGDAVRERIIRSGRIDEFHLRRLGSLIHLLQGHLGNPIVACVLVAIVRDIPVGIFAARDSAVLAIGILHLGRCRILFILVPCLGGEIAIGRMVRICDSILCLSRAIIANVRRYRHRLGFDIPQTIVGTFNIELTCYGSIGSNGFLFRQSWTMLEPAVKLLMERLLLFPVRSLNFTQNQLLVPVVTFSRDQPGCGCSGCPILIGGGKRFRVVSCQVV